MKDKLASLQDRYNSIRSDCDDHQDKLSEVYKAMDNLKRDRETIDGMIKRSKEQAGEMSPIASSIPILNSQLKEVVQHLSSIDAIKPEIASFAQECDDACDLMLLQAAPKLQREILKYPKAVEESVQDLEKTAIDRKKDIENKIQELKEIDDKLDNFISELARNKKDFDRQSSEPTLHPKTKKQLVDDFQKVHRALEKTLNKIDNKIDDFLSDLEETPFLKRRLQEARQKLDDFALSLNSGRDSADKVESILKKNEKERLSMMEQVLLLDEDLEALEPISINVAAATAQSLQNMTLSERCETLRRSLSDLKLDLDDVASDIPAATKKEIEEEQNKLSEKMDRISDKLKNRGDALDGVLPFITSLQDIEADVLPWLDDMSMSIASESAKPDTPEEIKAKIAAVKELLKDIEAHKIDLDDVATFGESALELVTSYDPDKMCQSAVDLGVHLEEVQKRYNNLKLQLDDLECELTNQEGIAQKLAEIAKSFDKVQEYTDNMPKPRLQEAELVQFMADIDEELGDVFILEEKMRVLENEYPNSASDPAVRAQLEKIKETKKTLEDKKDDLRDKSDMLDALSEDMADINNAIKSISPQKNTVPLTDLKSVEDNERYQEDLEPKISSLEDKLEKLEEVHARISKDCNPADVKKLQAKIDDLKKKCKDKEEKKNEKIEELKKTKDHLHKFDDASQKLSTWLENQINELKNQEPPSTSSNILKEQLDQHNQFTDDVQDEGKDLFKDLLKIGQVLKNDLLQNDKPLNDKIAELQKKYDNLLKDATKRQEELEAAMMDARNIRDTLDYIMPELLEKETELLKAEKPGADLETVQSQVEHHKADAQQLQSHAQLIASLRDQEGLGEEDQDLLDEIMNKWDRCNELSDERKEALSGAFDQILDFEKALADVGNFMDAVEAQLIENDGVPLSNIDIVDDMMGKHKVIQDAILTKSADVEFVNNLGDNYKNVTDPDQAAIIADKLEELNKKWDWLLGEVAEREAGLQKARDTTAAIDMRLNDLMAWLEDQEEYLKGCGPVADTYDGLVEQLGEHKNVHAGFDEHQDDYDSIVITCQELLTESEDPTVGESLDEKLQDLGQKWDSVVKASMARQRAIEEAMQICHDFQDSVNAILEWLPDAENALDSLEPISDDYETISEQIQELLQLSYFMADQNTAVEQVCTLGAIREETGPALSDDENARYKEMKDRYKELWNKIGARQDELNARQEALEAEDDLASFDITEWKKRFLRWMDGNHERIIDLFRKFDVNKDGTLSHQEFKDGIIQAGIPTPRSCFPTIIREFDRDDSGDINYREFAAALKRYEFKPKTEGEHIDYEVQRAVDRCSCRRRFNCVQVGEAKYRFGNMQKLYLVRILSTVVMVRVGGGWQPLHEFLQKYDPCRSCELDLQKRSVNQRKRYPWMGVKAGVRMSGLVAKGRTNVDLGKVKLKKDGEGRVISPLKFLTKFKPGSGPGTPRAQTPDGRARKPSAETSRGRITMSAGVRQSASREFEGLEIEHDAKQISFPGYKVKGGYVSPYSCQALGLKKRSGSQGSLCSSGSTEFDSPVRRSPSKNLNKSGSRSSVLSKSSSRGSISSRGSASVKGPGTFGIAARGLSASTPRSNSRSDLTKPGTARGTPSPVTRPRHMSPRSQSTVGMSPRTPTPRTPTPNRASPITRTQSEARMKPKTAPPAGTSTPVRQRTGAVSKSDSTGRTPISRRNTAANLSSSTPTTSTTRPKQTKPKKPAETKQ
ncbi:microtubule-actin cross-linking factor 1, isoforms 6/7-like isoform X4 [Bolinopsis microptera]|uniref:microtubule-actin cross-linking factor 1, isoforms 6/7-like isoform X4 n=1 Tax=Bolinopsis microptera TaxID=2820187 RepID=UPI0030799939